MKKRRYLALIDQTGIADDDDDDEYEDDEGERPW